MSVLFEGKNILTVGVFDLLHFGHFELFRRVKELVGDTGSLVVAVQKDEVVTKYKPQAKLMYDWNKRVGMISTLRTVDKVVPYADIDTSIKRIDFDVWAVGGDQVHSGFQRAIDWCKANGKIVIRMSRTQGISSTMIRGGGGGGGHLSSSILLSAQIWQHKGGEKMQTENENVGKYDGKTAITFGVFDLLHFGHFELFRRIRDLVGQSGRVFVMLQIDESIAKYKPGCKSVYDFKTRKAMIDTLRTVTEALPYDAVGIEAVENVPFDVLVVGPEHTNERFQRLFAWCEEHGKEVYVMPRTEGISTTILKQTIKDL